MKYLPLYKKIGVVIIGIIVLFNLSQVDAVSGETSPIVGSYRSYAENMLHTGYTEGEKQYKSIAKWYKEHNKRVKILPYILTVNILDFFCIVIILSLLFLIILRKLSR